MIPVCEPTLIGREMEYVVDCLKTNWISSNGEYISKFEESFSNFCGTKWGISCCNGTVALHLALEVLGISKGDEVIIPTFTMIATANVVLYTGARPVLVDSGFDTWNIDVTKIEEKITERTKAIMPVHTYGHPVDMDPLLEIAEEHDLFVIEDAAEAHGAEYKGKKTGGFGDMGCFSFYANKIITTGEGGMIVTNNSEFAERAELLRNHAFGEPRFLHKEVGFNYRMTNIQAAIGLAQMEKAEELVERRRRNAKYYSSLLKDIEGTKTPPEAHWAKNVYWMYGILIEEEFGKNKEKVREELWKRGIETRNFFIPMHNQPAYMGTSRSRNFPYMGGEYPVADKLSAKGFYLPSSSSLSKEQIDEVVTALGSIKGH
jgi:perosamine synthetase